MSSEVILHTAKAVLSGAWLAGCFEKEDEYEVRGDVAVL